MKVIRFTHKMIKYTVLAMLVAASICAGGCSNTKAHQFSYKGATYFVCGKGEARILNKCGLPDEITSDLAGDFISYLEQKRDNTFQFTETNTGTKLFEYGPEPNDNVYIVLIDGRYYAAILHDVLGYHGLQKADDQTEPYQETFK